MNARRTAARHRGALAGAALAAVLLLAAPAGAADGQAVSRVGLYVFIAAQSEVESDLPPGELRRIVEDRLAVRLEAAGARVHTSGALTPAIVRHRVRTSLLFDHDFLADVARDPGLDRLVLVDVLILPGNILLAARSVSVDDGLLRDVVIAEVDLADPELAAVSATVADLWRAALARLCAELPLPLGGSAPAARETLPLLPFEARGAEEVVARVASLMLLRRVLDDPGRAVPDPSLLVASLHEAGLDEHRLDPEARRLVAERLGGRRLVHPVLISYAGGGARRSSAIPDFDDGVHENVLLASGVLALWSVDLQAGELAGAVEHYFELRRETGWFGIEDDRTPAAQLATAIDGLWRSFVADQEEF